MKDLQVCGRDTIGHAEHIGLGIDAAFGSGYELVLQESIAKGVRVLTIVLGFRRLPQQQHNEQGCYMHAQKGKEVLFSSYRVLNYI